MGSVEMPSKHKAIVYDNPGSISTKIEEIDTPKPGTGEVLVNLYVQNLHVHTKPLTERPFDAINL